MTRSRMCLKQEAVKRFNDAAVSLATYRWRWTN